MKTPISIKDTIRALAKECGFDAAGFTAPSLPSHTQAGLHEFLEHGHHGDMVWMEEKRDRRADPLMIWNDVKSIIVLGQNYGPDTDPLAELERTDNGVISVYAQGKDYHDVLKKRLKRLAHLLHERYGGDFKVFTDTAPVMEKPLAAQTGVGWQGKHTCVVSREFGSWLFLGEIFTTLDIPPDAPEADHCGSCTSCLDICPTHAFTEARKLDARRCISYLTIEHAGHIAPEFRIPMGNRIYGCDDCLAVCPWNKFAQTAREIAYHPREQAANPPLAELVTLDDMAFRARFAGSPIKRTGRNRFIRNVLIAIGNSADISYLPAIEPLLADNSPLVRAMAVWATAQLADADTFEHLKHKFYLHEQDDYVIKEWKKESQA